MQPPVKSGPRYDNFIQSPKVRVIDDEGENLGVMFTREAIEQRTMAARIDETTIVVLATGVAPGTPPASG